MQQAPWEKYGGQSAPAQGPWSRYSAPQEQPRQPAPQARQAPTPIAAAPAPPAAMGYEESVGALLDQGYSPDEAERLAREQIAFDGGTPPPQAQQATPQDYVLPEGVLDYTALTPEELGQLPRGTRLLLPPDAPGQARQIVTLARDMSAPQRDAIMGETQQTIGGVQTYVPGMADAVGAFTSGAVEQVPFLDEGAVLADALMSGQGFSEARNDYQLMQEALNRSNRGERVAGGLAGFAGSLVAPGVGAGGRFVQSGANAADKVLRAGGLGALGGAIFGAGGAEGGLGDRAEAAALGAALGGGTGGVLQGAVNRIQRPVQETAQRRLSRQGQELTLGQMLGGGAQRIEDALTSVPLAGDVVRNRQRETLSSFDRLATNTALAPLGQALEDTSGRAGVRSADELISGAYQRALQGVSVDPADEALQASFQQVRNPQNLTTNDAADLNATLDNILSRAQGVVDGDTWKRIDSDLAAAVRSADAGAANRPSMSAVRDRLQQARTAWREALGRVSPDALEGVSAADAAEAQYRLVRKASADVASAGRGGDASPATLNRAVVSNAGDRRVARGESLLQDLTDDAMQVLPRTVPDSGTPFRSAINSAAIGGGLGVAGLNPGLIALAAALQGGIATAYSKPVQGLANRLYRASDRGGTTPDAALLSQMLLRSGQFGALGVPDAQSSRPETRRVAQ